MNYSYGDAIICLSYFNVKVEYRDQLITALLNLVTATLAEQGCLQYELVLDDENPNLLIMVEKFINRKALDDHEQQPYTKQFVESVMLQYCNKVTWNIGREIRF